MNPKIDEDYRKILEVIDRTVFPILAIAWLEVRMVIKNDQAMFDYLFFY